jgi:hypothetical protein
MFGAILAECDFADADEDNGEDNLVAGRASTVGLRESEPSAYSQGATALARIGHLAPPP